jgi:hypothetical protein
VRGTIRTIRAITTNCANRTCEFFDGASQRISSRDCVRLRFSNLTYVLLTRVLPRPRRAQYGCALRRMGTDGISNGRPAGGASPSDDIQCRVRGAIRTIRASASDYAALIRPTNRVCKTSTWFGYSTWLPLTTFTHRSIDRLRRSDPEWVCELPSLTSLRSSRSAPRPRHSLHRPNHL